MYSHYQPDPANNISVDTNRLSTVLANSWSTRVAVKTSNIDLAQYYNSTLPDYPPDLVPFSGDIRYKKLPLDIRNRILAAAWISYNEKAIAVENAIVFPACDLLLKGVFPGADSFEFKRLIAQTCVDEQFHILMSLDASLVARKVHNLESLVLPKAVVVCELEAALQQVETDREKEVIRLAFSTVAEVTINAYLNLLANAREIQPLNREITSLHRKDESSHNKIFKELNKYIYREFNSSEKNAYLNALTTGLEAFVKVDLNSWREILKYMEVKEADDIIDDCLRNSRRSIRDYSGMLSLLKDIDVSSSSLKFDFS